MQLYSKIRAYYLAYANQGGRTLTLKNMLQLSAGALPVCRVASALQNPPSRGDFVLASVRALCKGTKVLALGLAAPALTLHLLLCSRLGRHLCLCCVIVSWWFHQHVLNFCVCHCRSASLSLSLQLPPCPAELRRNILRFLCLFFFAVFGFPGLTLQNPSPPLAVACTLQWGVNCSLTVGASKARLGNCW